jgi:uncharacterized membrane protein required for colicin V production
MIHSILAMQPVGEMIARLTPADWVDIGTAIAVLMSVGLGAHRGLSGELPSAFGWVCGVFAGWYAYAPVHVFVAGRSFMQGQPELTIAAALVSVALLAWGVALLIRAGLNALAKSVAKTPVDAMFGVLIGLLRAFVILLIFTIVLLLSPWKQGRGVFCHESRTGRLLSPIATELLVSAQHLCPRIQIHRRTDDPMDQIESGGKSAGVPARK